MQKLAITAALLTSLVANISFASQYYKPGFATQGNDVRIGGFLEGSEQLFRSAENGLWLPVVPPLRRFDWSGAGVRKGNVTSLP
jgi:hypothetical protein